MAGMESEQLPSSIEEVEALILQLYQPGSPELVAKTQETLQKLQRSPAGWQLASGLVNRPDQQVRFFAALTFIVKLNTDAKSLSEDDARALLNTLISWLVQCMETSEGPLVVRKLCSTLVTYFLQFSTSWTRCLKHLMYCLCANEVLPYESLENAPETDILVQNLSDSKAVAMFWVAATLAEEVGKTDSNSMKQYKFHRCVVPNVDDITPLIARYISDSRTPTDTKVRQEAMKCFQSWVSYSHRAFVDDDIVLEPLRELIKPALICLADDGLYEITVELFSDVLANYSRFLHKEDFATLHSLFDSSWAQGRYNRLISGDYDFDSLQFGMFMIAFGDATVQDLTRNVEKDPQCHRFLTALSGLLGAEGYAVAEDKIYVPVLEFWNTFVEAMIDEVYSVAGGNPPWFPAAQAHVMQVIEKCWRKSQFPSSDVFNSWDSVDRTGFKDARRDFSDLLQQFHITTGIPLLHGFVELMHKAIVTKDWAEIEATMYCILSFADLVPDEPERNDYLDKIFSQSVCSIFAASEQHIPTRAAKGFLDLINAYADYFQESTAQLPAILNIVFRSTDSPSLAKTASRAIMKLCSDCRTVLLPELGTFIRHYGGIAGSYSLDGSVKASIMEGIASIIQAIPEDKAKMAPLEQLLNYVEVDVETCFRLAAIDPGTSNDGSSTVLDPTTGINLAAKDLGDVALKCLAGMAKGIQVPDDKPVDLDKRDIMPVFWISGEGSHVQRKIYSMVCRVYDAVGSHSNIVEEACTIFRHGFRETDPGPFVMPPDLVAQFLMKANINTPRLVQVINTATYLTGSAKWGLELEGILTTLLSWIAQLLHELGVPENDPEVAQKSIEFFMRLLAKFPRVFMNHQPSTSLEFLFMFTLKALAGNDPLPKQTAAEFWATFLSLPDQNGELQAAIDNAVQHLGPLVAQALIYNIGGHAMRSELDKLCDPTKKLVVRHVQSRNWFEAALLGDSFPSDKMLRKDKMVFLQKIMNLRGAKGTNQVVKEFWMASRGTNFAYTS